MKHQRPKPFLASATSTATNVLYEDIKAKMKKMTTQQMGKYLIGIDPGVVRSGTFTGSRSTAPSFFSKYLLTRAEAWQFGRVHRNKVTDECVMAVGYRQVVNLRTSNGEPSWNTVSDTVDDWFDYWDVVEDT